VQAGLLDGVAGCVAPGGVLAYSVCTWTAPETVEVVDAFLRRHRGFSVEPPRVAVDSAVGGVGLQLGTARHGTDGMYLALLRRAV
jgi:16S rRNA (cytosine967-C5)-methyltransferase